MSRQVRGEFKLDVPAIGTKFSSLFHRKAYNAVVGSLSMENEIGPVTTSATIDPAHRVYFDAALKVLPAPYYAGNRPAVGIDNCCYFSSVTKGHDLVKTWPFGVLRFFTVWT